MWSNWGKNVQDKQKNQSVTMACKQCETVDKDRQSQQQCTGVDPLPCSGPARGYLNMKFEFAGGT